MLEKETKSSFRDGLGRPIIKVCGMRDADNIRALDEARIADWMGFIFYKKSSRNVDSLPTYMPHNCKRVGVFVNEPIADVIERVNAYKLDIVQLHGGEDDHYIEDLRNTLGRVTQIIRTCWLKRPEDLANTLGRVELIDYFLFETPCTSYGGSGKKFDWDILQEYRGNVPFLITGGISTDDIDKIKSFHHPQFAGIDLNSRFEVAPALKDIELLKNFIKQLR